MLLVLGGQYLLWDCPHGSAPTGTCNPASHVLVTPPNLHSQSSPTPGHASVPQVDGPPDSPALHVNVDNSDQDIMITGYDQPAKPMTKVLLLENPQFWLPYHHRMQGSWCAKVQCTYCDQKLYYRNNLFQAKTDGLDRIGLKHGSLRPK